jgi:hypothetical protein
LLYLKKQPADLGWLKLEQDWEEGVEARTGEKISTAKPLEKVVWKTSKLSFPPEVSYRIFSQER